MFNYYNPENQCIPSKEWVYDENHIPYGKNGELRFVSHIDGKDIYTQINRFLNQRNSEMFNQLLEHWQGISIYENFNDNSPICVFVLYDTISPELAAEINQYFSTIKMPYEFYHTVLNKIKSTVVTFDLEIREEARLL